MNYMCQVGHNHRGILGSLGAGKFGDATTVIINLDGTAPDGSNDLAFVDAQLQEIQKNGDAYFDNLKTSGDLIATGAGASPLVADVLKALLTKSKGVPVLGSGAALVGLVGGIARHIAVQNQENAFNAMIASDRQTINNYAFGGGSTKGMTVTLTEINGLPGADDWTFELLTVQVAQNGVYLTP